MEIEELELELEQIAELVPSPDNEFWSMQGFTPDEVRRWQESHPLTLDRFSCHLAPNPLLPSEFPG